MSGIMLLPQLGGECIPAHDVSPRLDSDIIYGIGEVELLHWVCYALNLLKEEVVVYDSLAMNNGESTYNAFALIGKNVPIILQRANKREAIMRGSQLKQVWDVRICEDVPQLKKVWDCSVVAIKILQCLVSEQPLSILKPGTCSDLQFSELCWFFHKSFCVKLMGVEFVRDVEV